MCGGVVDCFYGIYENFWCYCYFLVIGFMSFFIVGCFLNGGFIFFVRFVFSGILGIILEIEGGFFFD